MKRLIHRLAVIGLVVSGCLANPARWTVSAQEQQPHPAPASAPALGELDAVKIEKAGLEVQLAQAKLQILERAAANLQWEAAELRRQLDVGVAVRDTLIRQAAERSKVDPGKCRPVVGAAPGWKCD